MKALGHSDRQTPNRREWLGRWAYEAHRAFLIGADIAGKIRQDPSGNPSSLVTIFSYL
jgi:hypothetical protein